MTSDIPPIVQSAARLLELARANLVEQKWEYGFCDCCAQPQQFEHTADCRFGLSEGVEELATAVIRMEKALRAAQWDCRGRCPVCAGWNVGPYGETDHAHTKDCPVGTALTPPFPPPAQTGEKRNG